MILCVHVCICVYLSLSLYIYIYTGIYKNGRESTDTCNHTCLGFSVCVTQRTGRDYVAASASGKPRPNPFRHVSFQMLWPAIHDEPPYILRAVIVHTGEAGGGHYTTYVRAQDHAWYFCDDWQSPRPVTEAEVLGAQAYLLFYDR